ncbi:hypothetical protein HYW46_06215 [Candidatus Daviesbacteria bacterium]|nr:hypothetical protein [Candidatus Daviesbacteria bacterium]
MLRKVKSQKSKVKNIVILHYVRSVLFVLFFSLFVLRFTFPVSVFAACNPDTETETDFGCFSKTDPLGFTTKLYEIGLGLIGGVALVAIVFGGFLILSSKGDQNQLKRGKSYIVSAIVGLVLAIAGFSIYRIIAANVIKIPGFQ